MLPSILSFLSDLFAGILATGILGAWGFLTRVLDRASYGLDHGGVGTQVLFEGSGSWT